MVRITLDSRSDEAVKAFESGVVECPSVVRCAGARHRGFRAYSRTELSRLPRVARLESSFALHEIVNRAVPPSVSGKTHRAVKR